MADKNLHFVAVIPPEPLQSEVYEFKKYISAKYTSTKSSLKSPAHITIIPPFSLKPGSTELVIKMLENCVIDVTPFTLQLQDFNFFYKQVVYIPVLENEVLNRLYNNIKGSFEYVFNKPKFHPQFTPHMTVANRDFIESEFAAAKAEFEPKKFAASFAVKSVHLLKFSIKEDKWVNACEIWFPNSTY